MNDKRHNDNRLHNGFSDAELQGLADRMYENFKSDIFLNAGKGFMGFIGRMLISLAIGFAGYYIGVSGGIK